MTQREKPESETTQSETAESAKNGAPHEGVPSEATPGRDNPKPWIPMVIGLVLVSAGIAVFARFGGGHSVQPPGQNDPYVAKLQIADLHMEEAANYAGGKVTYIEGKIGNTGDRKVIGASVEVVFKNSLNEVVQRGKQPVTVLLRATPYADYGLLDQAPLAPGQSRDFRLTLEHISADWDVQIPQVKVVSISY